MTLLCLLLSSHLSQQKGNYNCLKRIRVALPRKKIEKRVVVGERIGYMNRVHKDGGKMKIA